METITNKKGFIESAGVVKEALPDAKFLIQLDQDDREVVGYLSGKMRKARIRVLPGDKVKIEFSQYDENNCRIVYRLK